MFGWHSSMGSVLAHSHSQSGGACGAREGLLPDIKTCWLSALGFLGDTLLVLSDTLRGILSLLLLPWETPLLAVLLVCIIQSGLPFIRGREPAERASGWAEVYRKPGEKIERMARGLKPYSPPLWRLSLPTCKACAWWHFITSQQVISQKGRLPWQWKEE